MVKAPDARDSGNGDKAALVSQRVAGAGRRDPEDSQAGLRAPTLEQTVSKGVPPRPRGWACVPARHQPPCSASSAPKSTEDSDLQELRETFYKTRTPAGSIKEFFSC